MPGDRLVAALDPEQIRRVTEDVLSRPEYRDAQPGLLQRIWEAVLDVIARALAVLGGGGRGSIIGTIVLLGTCVALGVAALWFLRRVRRDPGYESAALVAPGRSATDWQADAEGHERSGRWRQALRCRYGALVADLAAAGLVEEVPGRTTGEYLRAVRESAPDAGSAFAEATRAFEGAWYGAALVTAGDVTAFRRAAQSARRAVRHRRAVARA